MEQTSADIPSNLSRYTQIDRLQEIFETKSIILSDQRRWTDQNDIKALELYRRRKGLGSVLALCFTTKQDTYFHWVAHAHGEEGVRIDFYPKQFLEQISEHNIRTGIMYYKTRVELKNHRPTTDELPFLKREQFKDEGEFRIISDQSETSIEELKIPINLDCIKRITLSPSPCLDEEGKARNKQRVKSIIGDSSIEVCHSRLYEDTQWIRALTPDNNNTN